MNSQKKNQLRERIRTLEGLTPDERSALLGLLAETKPYGLVWEEKPEDVEERLRDELPILREVSERAIISPDPAAPNHILIEGDNLEALSTLAYTHEGRIDVIYIDPPYNTGNKDFVYNDSFVDREDAFRHSKWLSFMAKRLRIAKKLLSERGVIFISIDDNEQAQLKLLCDEVFGEEHFIGNVIWEKTDSPRMDVKGFTTRHDFILVYGKENFVLKRIEQEEVPDHYNKVDDSGRRYYLKPLRLMGGHKSDSLYFSLIAPDGSEIYPIEKNGDKGCWRWSRQKTIDEAERIEWVNGRKGWVPYFKIFADNLPATPVPTIWTFDSVGSTRTAKAALTQIIDQDIFNYPKPVTLIQFISKIASETSSTVLDFFAGSGTTLHAVMQLNAEDGGHRQCILVTNNENGICENVTYKRNRRVIQGYTTPKGEAREGLHKNTLRYYKTDFIPRSRSVRNMRQLVRLATDMLCIKENIYTETAEFGGQKTVPVAYRAFREGDRQMLVVYREEAVEDLAEMIYGMEVKTPIIVYVFSPSEDAWSEQWEDVQDKVRPTALPAAIYNTYRRILPKKRDTLLTPEEDVLAGEDTTQSTQTTLFDEEDMA